MFRLIKYTALFCLFCFACHSHVVDKGDVTFSVLLDGKLQSSDALGIKAPFDGNILYLAEDGSTVATGDLLCELDVFEIEQEYKNKKFNWQTKKLELEELESDQALERLEDDIEQRKAENDVKVKEISLRQAEFSRDPVETLSKGLEIEKTRSLIQFYEDHLKELERLSSHGAISETELQERRLKLTELKIHLETTEIDQKKLKEGDLLEQAKARREYEKAQLKLEFVKKQNLGKEKARISQMEVVKSELAHLEEEMKKDLESLNSAKIFASRSGIFTINEHWLGDGRGVFRKGHRVWEGATIGELAAFGSIQAGFSVMERDVALIQKGMGCRIQVIPLKNREFRGEISSIGKIITDVGRWRKDLYHLKKVDVEIKLFENPLELKPKMTVLAWVDVSRVKNVTRVPVSCIQQTDKVQLENGGFRAVKLGFEGVKWIEVVSGVNPGEKLLCPGDQIALSDLEHSEKSRQEEFFRTVEGLGELRSTDEIVLKPDFSSNIKKLAKSGTEVKEGEDLVLLDSTKQESELQAAEIALEEKRVDLKSAKIESEQSMDEFEEELKSLESQLDIAKAQLEIYENAKGSLEVEKQALLKKEAEVQKGFQQTLFEIQSDLKREGYLKATDFQNSLEQLMGAENQLKLSNLELELADSPSSRNQIEKQKYEVDALEYTLECKKSMLEQRKRKSALTVEKAELALKEAEFKVASLKQYIRFASMKAEKDGVFIVNESWKNGKLTAFVEGDQVWPGTLVGRLVNLENFYISGQLAEEAFYELNPGQSVSFTLTGKEEKQYPGKLKKVASIPKKVWGGSNEPMIDVEIEVHAKSVLFQPGASVRYEVQVSESRQAVSIPHLALYEQSGEFFVFLDAAGKEKRKVVPGAKRGDRVEIVSGLTAGTEVFWMEWE